jgi:hypothetical protein
MVTAPKIVYSIRVKGTPLMTTQTFSDYVATQDARNDIQLNVRKYCLMLCDALVLDFITRHPISDPYKFYIESGRKYHKIIMETNGGSRSVHAFVDKKTGEVYKPASFKAPAKHVRFNLLMIESREKCFERADWAGGYLYLN